MLNDHERRTLRELERRFVADDPEFSRSFATRAQRLDRTHLGMWAKIALVATALLCALLLVTGLIAVALTIAVVTGLVWLSLKATPPQHT